MTVEQMRAGDTRPYLRTQGQPLTFRPLHPFRWLPRHGAPMCVLELVVQKTIKASSHLTVYTAVVVTVSLIVQFKGLW